MQTLNVCRKFCKKARKKQCNKLDFLKKKKKTPSKEFSKTLKLFLSDEVSIHPKILVFDNDRLTFNETEIVKAFSNSFENTIKTHDIKKKQNE